MFLRCKLLFVAIFISFYSFSQSDWIESIHLKSGNIVKGVIVENIPGKSVKIKTSDGSLFFFTLDEIEKITKTENTVTSKATVTDSYVPPKRFKYTKTGLSKEIRFGLFTPSCVQASFVLGYMPVSRWNIGLGISTNNYTSLGIANNSASYKQVGESSENSVFMPITIENTYFLTQSRASFYFFMDFGYAPLISSSTGTYSPDYGYGSLNDDYNFTSKAVQGGQYFCTGIGVRIALNEKITIKSDLGLLSQRYIAERTNAYYSGTIDNSNTTYFPTSFGFRTAILF
jgi:hypothetical protein